MNSQGSAISPDAIERLASAAERQASAAEAATGTGEWTVQDIKDQVVALALPAVASPELTPPAVPAIGAVVVPFGSYVQSWGVYTSNDSDNAGARLTFAAIYVPAGRPITRIGIELNGVEGEGDKFRLGLYRPDGNGVPRTRAWQSALLPFVDVGPHVVELDEPMELYGWLYATVEVIGSTSYRKAELSDSQPAVGIAFLAEGNIESSSFAVSGLTYRRLWSEEVWGDSDWDGEYSSDGSLPETLTWQWELPAIEPAGALRYDLFQADSVPAIFLGV